MASPNLLPEVLQGHTLRFSNQNRLLIPNLQLFPGGKTVTQLTKIVLDRHSESTDALAGFLETVIRWAGVLRMLTSLMVMMEWRVFGQLLIVLNWIHLLPTVT